MRDLVSTLILLGALQGAVLALVLWRRDANRLANRLLAALVALVALMLLAGEVERRWAYPGNPHLLGLAAPLPFLFGAAPLPVRGRAHAARHAARSSLARARPAVRRRRPLPGAGLLLRGAGRKARDGARGGFR